MNDSYGNVREPNVKPMQSDNYVNIFAAVRNLRNVMMLHSNGRVISIHKAVVLPLLDDLATMALHAPDKTCADKDCPMYREMMDIRVAESALSRLAEASLKDPNFIVTADEVDNLRSMLRKNYIKREV